MFGMMLYSAGSGNTVTAEALGFLTVPMQRISTLVAANASTAAQSATVSNEQLLAENKQLKEQITQYQKQLVDYNTYKQQNAQYKAFLDLKNKNTDYQLVSATVVGRDPNSTFYQFTIDQGTRSGIALYDPVITEAGVVGWISAVSSGYAKVTTILSPDTQISGIDSANQETGVVDCDLDLADSGLVRLSYLSAGTAVTAGDIVVTSGIGGLYPANLIVGTVNDVKNSTKDVSLYAEITPAVDVKTVKYVMIITSFDGQGEALKDFDGGSASASSGVQ